MALPFKYRAIGRGAFSQFRPPKEKMAHPRLGQVPSWSRLDPGLLVESVDAEHGSESLMVVGSIPPVLQEADEARGTR